MKKNGGLTFKEIAHRIREKKFFFVRTSGERRNALLAAAANNISITTRKSGDGQYQIIYL